MLPAAVSREAPPAIASLVALVADVVSQIETSPEGAPGRAAVTECNAVLESWIEAERRGDEPAPRATDELRRLGRLLAVADRRDRVFVMRQIRRVLARLDVRG